MSLTLELKDFQDRAVERLFRFELCRFHLFRLRCRLLQFFFRMLGGFPRFAKRTFGLKHSRLCRGTLCLTFRRPSLLVAGM